MIHPIEERYRTEIADIFEEKTRIAMMLEVEREVAKSHMDAHLITKDEYDKIKEAIPKITSNLVKDIEKETHHDIMALVQALTVVSGCDKVHIGVTSNDIVDTVLGLQLKKANEIIINELTSFRNILIEQARNKKELLCIGRTHGQSALPITYGLKFALWAYEINECLTEIKRIKFYGKISGAVGTFASFVALGEDGFSFQSNILKKLGLAVPLVTNQVISRIFLAQYLYNLITIGCVIEKIAKEIRNLQRTEILEIAEPFMRDVQTGSSTLPHKRNPHKSENLCAIAKRLRTNILPAFENISLEHERDLTNSANERIIIPETVILTHYMIKQASFIIQNLDFFEENIKRNLEMTPRIFMEKKMIDLIKAGLGRQQAYKTAKTEYNSLEPNEYLGLTYQIIDNVIEALK